MRVQRNPFRSLQHVVGARREWASYMARCQAMLQAGEPVADVLYFQGNDSPDWRGALLAAGAAGRLRLRCVRQRNARPAGGARRPDRFARRERPIGISCCRNTVA